MTYDPRLPLEDYERGNKADRWEEKRQAVEHGENRLLGDIFSEAAHLTGEQRLLKTL